MSRRDQSLPPSRRPALTGPLPTAQAVVRRAAGGLGLARLGALLLGAELVSTGCAVPLSTSCPGCATLLVGERPAIPAGTRTVYLLLPGLLGYGWEWNGAQLALAQQRRAALLVYEWQPWLSVARASEELGLAMRYLERRLPSSVEELVVIGHSAAGLVAIAAAAELRPPPSGRRVAVRILAIGAPLAGLGRNPWGGVDNWHTPLPIALGSRFRSWPSPVAGVQLEVFVTGADDPVMQRFWGHDPGDPRVLPPVAVVRKLPTSVDHNVALGWVLSRYLAPNAAPLPIAPGTPAPSLSGAE